MLLHKRITENSLCRYGTQGFFINNTIFHFGGVNEGVEFGNVTKPGVVDRLESVDIKNFATTRFDSPLNGYPPGLYYHGTVPDPEGHLFTIIGGLMHDGNDMAQPKKLRDMQSFAYARPSDSMYLMANLREGSAMPEQRWGHTLVYNSEGQIVLFGGCDLNNKAINSNIWIFDHATTSWIQKPTKGDAPSPRCMHSVVVIDDYMVVLFGKNADNSYVNDPVVALNMQTMEWSKELRLGAVPSTSSSASIDYGATNGAEALGAGATGGSSGLGGGAIAGIVIGATKAATPNTHL
ncbi:uncharacterized protein BYT42DRAFT_410488 [Radiomyces spectabilis]|uniref:uncharacterized protein n=1 Tax=Radiomyces spectabilis TaxID=64574 RepID=UPI002220BB45|nr:uncharacterized protein BYT42DRAFT_410488 [Radiomyces spectabilis]KAI8374545.1 hypothetical protein BYT42DRAFT_410488 [Radiomyces spectabilis]